MDQSPNLQLSYLMAAQSQKHVTYNESMRALDSLVQAMVLDKDLAAPPGLPADGDRYIVAPSPTGAWTGHAGALAAYLDGAWQFHAPREGWLAWVADEDILYVYDGADWGELTASGGGGGSDALDAIGALTPAADTIPYFTGTTTAALTAFTSFARSLVDDADAAAARTTLGLVIGSNVQAHDAELAALAGLASAADKLPYFTGSGTAALADFTSFGRSLVDDANASAARTTLGLGTSAVIDTGTSGTKVALLDGANTWSALQTISRAKDNALLALANSTDSVSSGFIYATSAQGTSTELVLQANKSGVNVLALQQLHASGYAAMAFRGPDGAEHAAFGYGGGGGGIFNSVSYFEASSLDGATAPPPLALIQTGLISGSQTSKYRLYMDATLNTFFFRIDGSTTQFELVNTGESFFAAKPTTANGNVLGIRANSTTFASNAGGTSSLLRLEQLGDSSAFLAFTAVDLTTADGLFRVHIGGTSATAPAFTLRHDGSGPWFGFQEDSNTNILTLASNGGTPRLLAGSSKNLQLGANAATILELTGTLVGWGGVSSSFPALKRSSAVLQARLADDSDYTFLQGKLRTVANAATETITPDKTLTFYDAAGTAFKVPCVAA